MGASTDAATDDRDRADGVETDPTGSYGTVEAALGGILGGLVGTAAFGIVMELLGLQFVRSFVPALLGLEQQGLVGWTVHLATGALLGLLFGLLVSRDVVSELLRPYEGEPELGPLDVRVRLIGAGLVYGLAVWALLPMVVLPVWLGYVGGEQLDAVPGSALVSMLAHVVFGLLLGGVYSFVVSRW